MAEYKKIMLTDRSVSENVDVSDNAVSDQVNKFSTDYTADKLNELYNEFDSITLDDSVSLTERNAITREKVSRRAVLYLTAGVIIASLLFFLVIYNFFVLSKVNKSINILQDDLTVQEYQVSSKASRVDGLMDEETIKAELADMGYSEIESENIITINESNYEALKGESNWFDKFCGFLNSVFGG